MSEAYIKIKIEDSCSTIELFRLLRDIKETTKQYVETVEDVVFEVD